MSNIIAFHGSDHKVGTSQLAECCAEQLAKDNPELEILLVQADTSQGYEYCPKVGESFDRIRPYVAQSIVNCEEIKSRSKYTNNLYVVGGNESPQNSGLFTPDLAEIFLRAMSDHFDIIIVDAGNDPVSGCCLGSLFSADRIYLVIRQSESSLRSFEWYLNLYERLDIPLDRFIVNHFSRKSTFELDYISERILVDKSLFSTVRTCPKGEKSEMEKQCLINMNPGRGFVNDIKAITKDILKNARIEN